MEAAEVTTAVLVSLTVVNGQRVLVNVAAKVLLVDVLLASNVQHASARVQRVQLLEAQLDQLNGQQ